MHFYRAPHSFTHPFHSIPATHPPTHPSIHACIHPPTISISSNPIHRHSPIYKLIHLPTNPLTHPLSLSSQVVGVPADRCVVIEDSIVGLKAAKGAGMRCIITYTDR